MLHHMANILVCYGGHFESKMVAKIQKSSALGKNWLPSRLWCCELISIVWEPCYDSSDHIISCGSCLFNAVSVALCGSEELSTELRYRACIEMVLKKTSLHDYSKRKTTDIGVSKLRFLHIWLCFKKWLVIFVDSHRSSWRHRYTDQIRLSAHE